MSHNRISPTAWLIAYQRSLTDIPLAPELYQELERIIDDRRESPEAAGIDSLKSTPATVLWEARFKIVNRLLDLHHANQILELAAGFSPRGLAFARDASATYVELDLPDLVQDKRRIVESLNVAGKLPALPKFHLQEGNALSSEDVLGAARHFVDAPVAVVNEGLLPYLDRAERTMLALNVRAILERFGGVWITPDIEVRLSDIAPAQLAEVSARNARTESLTGVNILNNRFESEEAARAFFEDLGFTIERHSFLEVADSLVFDVPNDLIRSMLERSVAYVMTI